MNDRQMGESVSSLAEISSLAKERLEVFKASIRYDGTYKTGIYKGVRSTSQQISDDYGSRFLIELIQNAYDAHPPDRHDGQIKVLLVREEDGNGVLYIANRGHGFLRDDVQSLCDIGTSNKPIGESIGNKGLGFRSVHYVTDDPQIYSKAAPWISESFDGYCFRFARGDDFNELLEDERHRALAKKDMPFFHIPVPLTHQPTMARRLAREGFSTVVGLPLRNESKLQLVIRLLREMRAQKVPLLLFLRRISSLEVVIDGDPQNSFCLLRKDTPVRSELHDYGGDELSCVDLGGGERYCIAWHTIPEAGVKAAIHESIGLGQLHPDWEDWKGDGELAVAVRLDGNVVSPRLYTYLPMGDQAKSPFCGYLHGSFYPKADRTSLDASIPINSLYMDEAPRLCVRVILMLRKMRGNMAGILSREERKTAIVDLLAWNSCQCIEREGVSAAPILMREAFQEVGINFPESDILPIVPRRRGDDWGTPNEVRRWEQTDLKIFGTNSLARILNQAILLADLGQERLDRLEEFISNGDDGLSLNPPNTQLSHWTEMLAAHFLTPPSSKRTKTAYYLELEKVLRTRPVDLSGRKILYCSDGVLRASEPTQDPMVTNEEITSNVNRKVRRLKPSMTIIFSPSKRSIHEAHDSKDEAQILQVPKELEKNIAFLSDELGWYKNLEEARKFLEEARLVRRYDATELVAHVSFLSRINRRVRIRKAALSWVFDLWLSYQNASRALTLQNVSLLVPTLKGRWVEAKKAIFSAGWPARTVGDTTEEFLSQTGSCSDELMRIGHRLLAHRTIKPFRSSSVEKWSDFLEVIGVNKGLRPLKIDVKDFKMMGWELTIENICGRFSIGESTKQYWQKDTDEHTNGPKYRRGLHELDGGLWYFPGQKQYDTFSEEAKLLYSQLILQWLESADSEHFEVGFVYRPYVYDSRFNWPTPLAAFIRHAPWFPVEIQEGLHTRRIFLKPSEVWILNEEESYRWPPYMPNIPRETRRRISEASVFNTLVKSCNINVLNDRASLPKQVWYLGKLYKEGRVDSYHFAAFINAYNETWSKLANADVLTDKLLESGERYLITQQNNQYTYVDIVSSDDFNNNTTSQDQNRKQHEIYVRNSENNLGIDLVAKQGAHLFDPGPQDAAKIAEILRNILGERFRAVSDIQIALVIEGKEYIPEDNEESFAVNICPWLPHVVNLSMEALKGPAAQRLPVDRSIVITRLHNIRIRKARNVQYKVGDAYIPLTDSRYGATALRGIRNPLLIIQSDAEDLDWDALANASSQLAQLIGQTDLASPMKMCFRRLQSLQEPATGPVTDYSQGVDELCRELELERTHAEKALQGLSNNIMRLGRFLRPIICYFKGIDASTRFGDRADQSKTLYDLMELLKAYLGGTNLSPESLINTCQRATGFGDIQDDLKLSFGAFNRSLIAVGEDLITHPDQHVAVVRSFVAEHKDTIMNCLRVHFRDRFRNRESLQDYIRCREQIEILQPKKEWLIDFPVPDTSMVRQLVNDWLAQNNVPIMNAAPKLLPPWSRVRTDNKSRIRALVRSHGNTVKAWCYKRGIEPPEVWNDIAVSDDICNALDKLGSLDFESLEEPDLISWLVIAGVWPKEMPPTTIVKKLGLNEKDLQEESNRERAAKLKEEKEARSIVFNGRQIDPQDPSEADAEKLAEEVKNKLSRAIRAMKPSDIADLHVMPEPRTKRGPSGGHGKGGGRKIPQEKTDIIGFLGECAVYYWLKRLQPGKDIDTAWVSGYRSRLLLGAGDDSLGYDFEITYRNQPWYLEVKSSLGDIQEFELGDTEIRMARDCAAKKGKQYRIIHVSNIQNSAAMQLEVLPNPLSDEGKVFFRIGGQGIRYQFLRKT